MQKSFYKNNKSTIKRYIHSDLLTINRGVNEGCHSFKKENHLYAKGLWLPIIKLNTAHANLDNPRPILCLIRKFLNFEFKLNL